MVAGFAELAERKLDAWLVEHQPLSRCFTQSAIAVGSNQASATRSIFLSGASRYPATIRIDNPPCSTSSRPRMWKHKLAQVSGFRDQETEIGNSKIHT